MIDHFGRVDPVKGIEDPDYQKFLSLLNVKQHWIKVSGFYRLGATPSNINIAQQAYNIFKEKVFYTNSFGEAIGRIPNMNP